MPAFRLQMDIDANGVVVAVFSGRFDASEWLRQRTAVFESRYGPDDYDGLPVVTDFTDCRLPDRGWTEQFEAVAQVIGTKRPAPFRHAIVLPGGTKGETAVALFGQYQKLIANPGVVTRRFEVFDEAYAWALEGLGAAADRWPQRSPRGDAGHVDPPSE